MFENVAGFAPLAEKTYALAEAPRNTRPVVAMGSKPVMVPA